jgi:hypothetical protein
LEEYQNSDYTKKALKELNEQLKSEKFKPKAKSSSDDDDVSGTEYSPPPSRVVSKKAKPVKRKRSLVDEEVVDYTRALQERVDGLQKRLTRKSDELDVAETRLYQSTLDLSNSRVDLDTTEQFLRVVKNDLKITQRNVLMYRLKYYAAVTFNVMMVIGLIVV